LTPISHLAVYGGAFYYRIYVVADIEETRRENDQETREYVLALADMNNGYRIPTSRVSIATNPNV